MSLAGVVCIGLLVGGIYRQPCVPADALIKKYVNNYCYVLGLALAIISGLVLRQFCNVITNFILLSAYAHVGIFYTLINKKIKYQYKRLGSVSCLHYVPNYFIRLSKN